MKLLKIIKKHLILSIIVSVVLGVVVGGIFDVSWLKSTILPLTFLLVYPMMVTLNLGSLKEKSNIRLQLATQIINFIIFPLVAYLIGMIFFKEEVYMRLGLLLIALLPTSGMTISWTVMAKGNVNEAIRMVIIGLSLGAILSPFYITFFLGAEIAVPFKSIFTQIFVVVFIPLLTAYITQKLLISKYGKQRFHQKIKPVFPLFSTLGVVLIIFVAIALKAKVLLQDPSIVLQIALPLILLYVMFVIISVGSAKLFFNKENGIALTNGTLIRSLSLSLAIALNTFSESGLTALLIAIAYVLQVQVAAWNVKLSDKIYK
jgi:ACR3 family arsenite efflux pump ArsB